MRSVGSFTREPCFFSVNDRAKDMLPILPLYMSRISGHLDASVTSLVMPVEIPTVPMAENTSIKTSDIGMACSSPLISKDEAAASSKLIKNMVLA